jgi:membrane associated rhomboid family serine protease
VLTRLLVAVNVIAYLWEQVAGIDRAEQRYGLIGQYVLAGQWYRIFTSAFMHANLMHIAFNMFALYQVGTFVELIYGTPRMAMIYLVALLGGGAAVTYFAPDVVTVGASGAIFGLFGALAIAGFRLGKPGRDIMRQTTGIIVINLVIGFLPGTNISIDAHIGGLVAGTLCGLLLFRMPRQREAVHAAPDGMPYAQRIDPSADPGVVTIEHGPVGEPPRPSPPSQ